MFENEEKLKKLILYFTWIESIVRISNDFAYTDINISIESFILKILNILNLEKYDNCNLKKINYPTIDLIDTKEKVGIQITSEATANKIKETLINNQGIKIKFFFLDSSYKPRQSTFNQFENFDVKEDVINFKKIISLLETDSTKLDEVLELVQKNIVLPINTENFKKIIEGYDSFYQEIILKDIQLTCERFVPTKITLECLKHLENKNLLILIGNPGVGKSYNSKFIVAKYMEKGYKLLYSPNKNLKDILKEYNQEEKFVLFIDDIFGSNNIDFMSAISEPEIVSLLENNRNNLKIIINSRTSFFNDVNEKYDKIGRLNLKPFVIETSNFSYVEKARILIKHLKLSQIPQKNIYSLFDKGKVYIYDIPDTLNIYGIIYHKNFNPRLIELMTRLDFVSESDNYFETFIKNLDNPYLIYNHSYNQNLENKERIIIKSIFLKSTYKNNYEIKIDELYKLVSNFNINEEEFKISLRKLEQSFIKLYNVKNVVVCKFYDPSIMDYCINKFKNSNDIIQFVEYIDDKDELDNILLNDRIDDNIKINKIIDLKYSNFKILRELDLRIIKNKKLLDYIKNKIFDNDTRFGFYEEYFCREEFINDEELFRILREKKNIDKYISFSNEGIDNRISELILKRFDDFSEEQQDKILTHCISEINDISSSEVRTYINYQKSIDDCNEDALKSEYENVQSTIIANVSETISNKEIIDNITFNLDDFDTTYFSEYIKDVFEDNYKSEIVNNDKNETIKIVDNYYKSII